jgi:general secretion pathway protein H
MSANPRGRQTASRKPVRLAAAGFTLLEILVVVVIIGVIIAAATLSVGVLGRDSEAEEEARRFWAVLRQTSEEAEIQSLDVAVFVSAVAYEFLRFDQKLGDWTAITDDPLYAPRALPEGLRFRLRLDAREIVLKPMPPNRSDKDENKKWPPQIVVLSNGEIMPFELRIERDNTEALWRLVAGSDNDLRIERRDSNQEWTMVMQTRPPPEEADQRRAANASR